MNDQLRLVLTGIVLLLVMPFKSALAVTTPVRNPKMLNDSVREQVNYLNYFLSHRGYWYAPNHDYARSLEELIHFVEDDNIDTVISKILHYQQTDSRVFVRPDDHVSDSLSVDGYMSAPELRQKLKQVDRSVRSTIVPENIPLPDALFKSVDSKVNLVAKGQEEWLLEHHKVQLPDSLKSITVLPDSLIPNADDRQRIHRLDSLRKEILDQARQTYNQQLISNYKDSIAVVYRNEYIRTAVYKVQKQFSDSVSSHNRLVLSEYNQKVIRQVNDSVMKVVASLRNYAANDSTFVKFKNLSNDSTGIWLRRNDPHYTRLYVQNEQHDSVGIRIENVDKNTMKLLVDDAVMISRFARRPTRGFRFKQLDPMEAGLKKVPQYYEIITPWTLTAKPNMGFTQTGVTRWKSGGGSSFAFLFTFNGTANYAKDDVSWKNTLELRDGWVKPGSGMIEKNDDDIELTSRVGLTAYKKWNYSTEVDIQSQLFDGWYDYSSKDSLISSFLSPADIVFKVGMEYSPNSKFSVLLSPISSKTVVVKDIDHIDETSYGLTAGRHAYWQVGFNADIEYEKELTSDITLNTKYKMFMNYGSPFRKYDVDWENDLTIKFNSFINMNAMVHWVYDDDVKFDTGRVDEDGNAVLKAKWQCKELITIGFTYTLSKNVYRRKKIN